MKLYRKLSSAELVRLSSDMPKQNGILKLLTMNKNCACVRSIWEYEFIDCLNFPYLFSHLSSVMLDVMFCFVIAYHYCIVYSTVKHR